MHYRDDFISWIDPHVSKSVGRVLLNLYNQVLEQLEVELDVARDCLEESMTLEKKWVKTIISMANERAKLRAENDQRIADLEAQRDEARQFLLSARAAFETSVAGFDERFSKMKEHFDKASARAQRMEKNLSVAQEQLVEAQDRIRELEASHAEQFRRETRIQEQSEQHRRALERAERRLEESRREASSRRPAPDRNRRR
jgi:chromosome segregation ATPase